MSSSFRSKFKNAFSKEKSNERYDRSRSPVPNIEGAYSPSHPPRQDYPFMPTYGSTGPNNTQTYSASSTYNGARPIVTPSYATTPSATRSGLRPSYPGMLVHGQNAQQGVSDYQPYQQQHSRQASPQPSYRQPQDLAVSRYPYNAPQMRPDNPNSYAYEISSPYSQYSDPDEQYRAPYYQPFRSPEQNDRHQSPNQQRPIPQLVVVPDDDSASDSDGGPSEVIFLVKTSDGRYLPVALGNGANISRVPSPAPPISERHRAPRRTLYADSISESSTESLQPLQQARPAQPKFGMTRDEWNQTSDTIDDEVEEGETFVEQGNAGLNLNRRYNYLPLSMVPFWYKKNVQSEPEDSRKYLCATCRHVDLLSLFRQEEIDATLKLRDYVVLGSLESLLQKQNCGFCSLVARIIGYDTGIDLPPTLSDEQRLEQQRQKLYALFQEVYYLCPIRFKTMYREPALYIFSGKEIAETAEHSTVRRPRRSMAIAPMHNSAPNHGRVLRAPDQIDFKWVKNCMVLCDARDIGKLDYTHRVKVRAIDVQTLRVVPLEDAVRYVTLSYVWGQVTTLRLLEANLKQFETRGLGPLWGQIPKTIRDSIELVRKIGERYIWVDALCIVQDDKTELLSQIGEMGSIYRNSILTICICCGDDANYGVPGIEPGTRKTRQIAGIVGQMPICNTLYGGEDYGDSKWDTRGWTLQEKVLSQRKLLVSDTSTKWWCWHTSTTEDQNCRHCWWDEGTPHRGMYFFKTEHDLVVSKLPRNCNFDTYAFMVEDYTARHLSHESDAELAVQGVFRSIGGSLGGKFHACIPDTEISAALLWTPLGPSKRRNAEAMQKLPFPSWSWLGWVGHVAYPWLIERTLPMSEKGCPLLWRNMARHVEEEEEWFTGEDYRTDFGRYRLDSWSVNEHDNGWSWTDSDDPDRLYLNPVESHSSAQFFEPGSLQLHFRTLSATLTLEGTFRTRKENHDHLHKVYYMRILNSHGLCVGYIHTPEPEMSDSTVIDKFFDDKEFIVLSRASTNPDASIGQELLRTVPIRELHSVYSLSHTISALERLRTNDDDHDQTADEMAYFDTRLYDSTTPWGLFNVMMIERAGGANGIASRLTVGRIHVAAFMEADPVSKEITLE